MNPSQSPFIAAGIGNTSLQFGRIESDQQPIPLPTQWTVVPIVEGALQFDASFPSDGTNWYVASVNPPITRQLTDWVESHGMSIRVLTNHEFPVRCNVASIDRVGADRLAAAVATNALRDVNRPAIFIDAGTAMTVNAISAEGTFLGGAILPGTDTSLRALAHDTAQLPHVELDLSISEPPKAIGIDTDEAIRSGVFWGLVGAARQLADEMRKSLGSHPHLFVTGGFGPWLSQGLALDSRSADASQITYVPHLVLTGVALTAAQWKSNSRRSKH